MGMPHHEQIRTVV